LSFEGEDLGLVGEALDQVRPADHQQRTAFSGSCGHPG
jgi:hypothetical protein